MHVLRCEQYLMQRRPLSFPNLIPSDSKVRHLPNPAPLTPTAHTFGQFATLLA